MHAALTSTGCCARFAAGCRLLCMLRMPCPTQAAVHAAHAVLPDACCRHISKCCCFQSCSEHGNAALLAATHMCPDSHSSGKSTSCCLVGTLVSRAPLSRHLPSPSLVPNWHTCLAPHIQYSTGNFFAPALPPPPPPPPPRLSILIAPIRACFVPETCPSRPPLASYQHLFPACPVGTFTCSHPHAPTTAHSPPPPLCPQWHPIPVYTFAFD